MDFLVDNIVNCIIIIFSLYFCIVYLQELELGTEGQSIVKKGNKLYLIISETFNEAKQRYPDKLREYNINFTNSILCSYVS